MANRHAGRLADVWKHLALAELLAVRRPTLYAETHAGNAVYPDEVPHTTGAGRPHDPASERIYGIVRFLDVMDGDAALADSRYGSVLRDVMAGSAAIPGSPAVAMAVLGAHADYLLCDIDPASTADIERWAVAGGLGDHVATVTADGMHAVGRRMLGGSADPDTTFVHVDPDDPLAPSPDGVSALDLTRSLIAEGVAVMYWYGSDTVAHRTWALTELAGSTPLWCGSMLCTTADGGVCDDGDLGAATTPGTGWGVVCANVGDAALDRCARLGHHLADDYRGVPLPSGGPGALDFVATTG